MNNLAETNATLLAHCGARKITREELKEIPVPEGTRTHQPVSHFEVVETLTESLGFRFLKVVRDEYAVSPDGMKMFGVMDLNSEFDGCRFSIGLRNSNDKSMRLALTAGLRVMVCDNMAFSGDFNPLFHKHTKNLELADSIALAVDRIHRNFLPFQAKVSEMKKLNLSDEAVKLVIYEAFVERKLKGLPRHLLPLVHELYFQPKYEEFEARSLWSLSNAFTSAFKEVAPLKQFEITARLGAYLGLQQEYLTRKFTINLELPARDEKTQPLQIEMTAGEGLNLSSSSNDFNPEDIDEDDIAGDPGDEFDDYADSEAESEVIDEAEDELTREYEQRVAA
ncbi:MAG TPA: DUF932 domain-containing protein [Pyrinomonadaceae bacterium]|jgi:hypothetical protein